MYKAVEIGAPEKYDLTDSTYYFGIGTSRQGKKTYLPIADGIGGVGSESINTVATTTDGGYIVGGFFSSESLDLGNGISLVIKVYRD